MYTSIFFFKQKAAYEVRISDWSSDVCSSDLNPLPASGERSRRASARASGQAQQSFTDDVALDLRRAAGDGFGKHVEIVVSPAVHADDFRRADAVEVERKSTRLNSSH